MLLAICAFSVLVPTTYSLAAGPSAPSVVISNITFVGRSKSPDVDFFGGIPFAEPPLGDLRLRPPVLKSFLNDSGAGQTIFNATQFGPSCIQIPVPQDSAISEDCLSVNIFKPSSSATNGGSGLLPVMLWFYGGGFIIGSSSRYDGTPLVSRSILRGTPTIIVSASYRMGPLGFPRGNDVTREAEGGSPILNLGIRDNVAAIQWIKQHISVFGGDPNKVTIFGESAGALAIQLLVLNDQVRGLAKGAIMESTGGLSLLSPSNSGANEKWNDFIAAIPRCQTFAQLGFNDTVDCMRSITTSEIIEGYNTAGLFFNTSGWSPVIDGEVVPDFPTQLKPRKGVVEAVLIGSNLDEGTLIAPQNINSSESIKDVILSSAPSPPNASPEERQIQLEKLQLVVEQILRLYPNDPSLGSPFGTGNNTFGLDPEYKRFAAADGDFISQSYRRHLINDQLLKAEIPTFSYLFADPDAVPVPDFVLGTTAPGSLGVPHSSEIFYVFGNLSVVTPTATDLSNVMMDYWISFANSFSPNDGAGSARPFWSEYTLENKVILQLNGHNTTMIPDDFRKEQIAIFNKNPSIFAR